MDGIGVRTFVQGIKQSGNQMTLITSLISPPDFDAYHLICGFMFVEKTQLLADLAEAEERHVRRCNNFNSRSACKTFWIRSP